LTEIEWQEETEGERHTSEIQERDGWKKGRSQKRRDRRPYIEGGRQRRGSGDETKEINSNRWEIQREETEKRQRRV
jgi:hypothetical protein